MAQKKLKRFGEIKTFSNVLESPENMKGKWNEFFNNENEIVLELACGKGEYTTGWHNCIPKKILLAQILKETAFG